MEILQEKNLNKLKRKLKKFFIVFKKILFLNFMFTERNVSEVSNLIKNLVRYWIHILE